jgi:hypothetical protein
MALPPDRELTPEEKALWRVVMGDGGAPSQPERETALIKKREPAPTKSGEYSAKAPPAKPPQAPVRPKPEVQVVRGR